MRMAKWIILPMKNCCNIEWYTTQTFKVISGSGWFSRNIVLQRSNQARHVRLGCQSIWRLSRNILWFEGRRGKCLILLDTGPWWPIGTDHKSFEIRSNPKLDSNSKFGNKSKSQRKICDIQVISRQADFSFLLPTLFPRDIILNKFVHELFVWKESGAKSVPPRDKTEINRPHRISSFGGNNTGPMETRNLRSPIGSKCFQCMMGHVWVSTRFWEIRAPFRSTIPMQVFENDQITM
jgi:hypothetical protein